MVQLGSKYSLLLFFFYSFPSSPSFVEYAPWKPRGWHSTTVYNNTIWMIGGTPLNNEVWVLTGVSRLEDREPPLTRAM